MLASPLGHFVYHPVVLPAVRCGMTVLELRAANCLQGDTVAFFDEVCRSISMRTRAPCTGFRSMTLATGSSGPIPAIILRLAFHICVACNSASLA
jgi:hypothetical protein